MNRTDYPKYRELIKVAKGDAQQTVNGDRVRKRFGADLEDRLRVTSDDPAIAKILKDSGYDNIVEKVNIYFPYDLPEENCPVTFLKFNSMGVALHKCNGAKVYEKHGTIKDSKNNVFNRPVACDEPCRNPEKFSKCPAECTRNGNLKFFIRELFDAGLRSTIARMSLHSFTDLEEEGGLLSQLKTYYQQFGSLAGFNSPSPYLSFQTNGYIPFVLTRVKVPRRKPVVDRESKLRTGASTMSYTWAVNLAPDPEWLQAYELLQKVAIARNSGHQIPAEYELAIIQRTAPSYAGFLPGAIPVEPEYTEEAKKARAREFLVFARSRSWSDRALKYFMNHVLDVASLMSLPAEPEKLNRIKQALCDADPQDFDAKAEELV